MPAYHHKLTFAPADRTVTAQSWAAFGGWCTVEWRHESIDSCARAGRMETSAALFGNQWRYCCAQCPTGCRCPS